MPTQVDLDVHIQLDLDDSPTSPSVARAFVRKALSQCPDYLIRTAELLTSELVTNAIVHGALPIGLEVDMDSKIVTVAVTDGGRRRPVMLESDRSALHGRGVRIIDNLADVWGVRSQGPSKTVWFILTT